MNSGITAVEQWVHFILQDLSVFKAVNWVQWCNWLQGTERPPSSRRSTYK